MLTTRQESGYIEVEKYLESIDEDEQQRPEDTPICNVWLEGVVVEVLFEIKSLSNHSTSYTRYSTEAQQS